MITAGHDRAGGLVDGEAALAGLARWQAEARPGKAAPIHALMLSLKRFSAVNLAYGEAAGDSALAEILVRIGHFARGELEGEWLASRAAANGGSGWRKNWRRR